MSYVAFIDLIQYTFNGMSLVDANGYSVEQSSLVDVESSFEMPLNLVSIPSIQTLNEFVNYYKKTNRPETFPIQNIPNPYFKRKNALQQVIQSIIGLFKLGSSIDKHNLDVLIIATMNGYGKTTFSNNLISDMIQEIENNPKLIEDKRILSVFQSPNKIIDISLSFNSEGIQISETDRDITLNQSLGRGSGVIMGRRVVATYMLKAGLNANTNLFIDNFSLMKSRNVIQIIFENHRKLYNISSDELVLMCFRIDEHQQAIKDISEWNIDHSIKNNVFKDEIQSIVYYNIYFSDTNNRVIVMCTGTSSPLIFGPTQISKRDITLDPFTYENSSNNV